MQAFCSYLTGTLATQAILKGVGVGDSSASPVAATITWLLKGVKVLYVSLEVRTTSVVICLYLPMARECIDNE